MEWRSPSYNAAGSIDCEINHPVYGWVPFTVVENDTGAAFNVAEMRSEILASGNIAAYVPPPPSPPRVPAEITRIQFVRAMRAAGLWEANQAAIEAHEDWPYVTAIPRNDPIVQAMASGLGFTTEQLDALWIAGAQL